MNLYWITIIGIVLSISCDYIEEEVLGNNNQHREVPHHPGLSSNKKSHHNKNVYHHEESNHYNEHDYNNPSHQHQHQQQEQGHNHPGHPSAVSGNRVSREELQGRNLDDLQYRNLEHMHNNNNGHMGGPMGMNMNMDNMGGGMGMGRHDRMNDRINQHSNSFSHGGHSNFNSHSNHHQTSNTQFNSNNNRKSWFSGTFGTLYEIMMILFLLGLVYNCIFGRHQNDKHAMSWYEANRKYFEERYENIGFEKKEMEDELGLTNSSLMKDSVIVKESPYLYRFNCSRYRYIKCLSAALEFKKRYDASSMITSLFLRDTDKLIYQVSFQPVDPLGWVFCVCKKREAVMAKRSYADLAFFTNNYEPSVMNERMCLLSENLEIFMQLFQNKTLLAYYNQIERYLDVIYFTDQASFCEEPFAVFFSFDINLTYAGQEKCQLEITHFVNLFIDTLAQIKYQQKFRDEVQKNRIAYERSKMEEGQRREIEDKEKNDFIEKWKIKNKMKYKKGAERKKLERELAKYN